MSVQRLYPQPAATSPLEGLYLGLNLHRQAGRGEVLIYSNFVASLDGRISRFSPERGDYEVPASIANERDWRLYQELAAQSDILITSARYFRQLSSGTAQDILPVGDRFNDLQQWRLEQGLKPQPDVAIFSRTLDIPAKTIEMLASRSVYLFTSDNAPADRREALESRGVTVIAAGEQGVEGVRLKAALAELGFRSAYMIAGPGVHTALIGAGVLDRLFLTTRFALLGSEQTHGFFDGSDVAGQCLLKSLYLDQTGEQLFAQYEFGEK